MKRTVFIALSTLLAVWQFMQVPTNSIFQIGDLIREQTLRQHNAATAIAPYKTYLWSPQVADLPRGGSTTQEFFYYLLTHADSKLYRVRKGDSLDRILRNQFFVSGTLHPRAYSLYFGEIVRRSGLKRPFRLLPNCELHLPMGPHYSAIEAPIPSDDVYVHRASHGLSAMPSSQRPEIVEKQLYHALGRYSWIFPSPKSGWSQLYIRKHGIEEIIERRILPGGQLDRSVDLEPVTIYEWSLLPADAGERLRLPGYLMPMGSKPAVCSGNPPCTHCAAVLKIQPDSQPEKRAKLLIVDTGIDSGAMHGPDKTIFYSPQNPDDQNKMYAPDDWSDNHHGTFVYSETVEGLQGPLNEDDVRIAKVSIPLKEQKGEYVLSLADALRAFQKYGSTRRDEAGQRDQLPVWIVNLSMYGAAAEMTTDEHSEMRDQSDYAALPANDKILYVAAAGNDSTFEDMWKNVFTRFDKGASNVLVVGALDSAPEKTQVVAGYSNRSDTYVDLFAQGSCICGNAKAFVSHKPDIENQINGTSQAAPIAAVAAQMLANRFPTWSAQQLKWRLIATTDLNLPSLERLNENGKMEKKGKGGRLNLPRALNNDIRQTLLVTSESSFDQSIAHVTENSAGWEGLLKKERAEDQAVLRVHWRGNQEKPPQAVFEIIRFADDRFNYATVPLPLTQKLWYQPANGTERKYIEAKDLRELIQPIY